jgi:outer membrane lipopolysaccharide assembly protein LptE/RlpB
MTRAVSPGNILLQRESIRYYHNDVVMRLWTSLVVTSLVLISGCGYRLANKNFGGEPGQTIAVPTFINKTTTYRIEQRMTEAVRQELIQRTRFKVVPESAGDMVLTGEVLSYAAVPVLFNQQGRGSAYRIVVDLSVKLTNMQTGKVVFQNDHWNFGDVFELAQSSADFVPEDTAALERLSRRFASSLVATVMHSK